MGKQEFEEIRDIFLTIYLFGNKTKDSSKAVYSTVACIKLEETCEEYTMKECSGFKTWERKRQPNNFRKPT